MITDAVSGAMPVGLPSGLSTDPVGNTYRGIGSSWFNGGNVAREDWLRSEQSANNEYIRQMASLQKQQEFSERMRDTQYTSMIKQMKESGINPVLAFQQGGASAPSQSSGYSGSPGYRANSQVDPLTGMLQVVAGLILSIADASTAQPKGKGKNSIKL